MAISIIICYTNKEILNRAIGYVNTQIVDGGGIEYVALDNRKKRWKSVAEALNYGAAISKGDILIFMHQDMMLLPENAVERLGNFLTEHPNDLVGVAGKRINGGIYNLFETEQMIRRTEDIPEEPVQVETLDECLLAMTKDTWRKFPFDAKNCYSYHLYGTDLSYTLALNGRHVWCFPLKVWHLSLGAVYLDRSFYKTLWKLRNKYKGKLQEINSPCMRVKLSIVPFILVTVKYRMIKFGQIKKAKFLKFIGRK